MNDDRLTLRQRQRLVRLESSVYAKRRTKVSGALRFLGFGSFLTQLSVFL